MANNKISWSQLSQFMTCPKKYEYHYKYRYREKTTSAALLWGSAIDETLGAILNDHKKQRVDYLGQEYHIVFTNNWRRGFINKKNVELFNCEDIVYAKADFDPDLILPGDLNMMVGMTQAGAPYEGVGVLKSPEECFELVNSIRDKKEAKGWANLKPVERKFYNHMHWLSMHRKGVLLINAYIAKILPQVKEVLAIQQQVELVNEDGDSVIGYIDAVVRWVDGRIVIVDHKTAAREYDWDSVLESVQLTMYVHAVSAQYENTRTAGYIVLQKNIQKNKTKVCTECGHNGTGSRAKTCDNKIDKKRCGGAWKEKINPEGVINVIINDIPERTEEIVMENLADVNHVMKQGMFTRNLMACDTPFPCPFKKLCWQGSMEDLVDLNKEDSEGSK